MATWTAAERRRMVRDSIKNGYRYCDRKPGDFYLPRSYGGPTKPIDVPHRRTGDLTITDFTGRRTK